jgi:hypothetical protein
MDKRTRRPVIRATMRLLRASLSLRTARQHHDTPPNSRQGSDHPLRRKRFAKNLQHSVLRNAVQPSIFARIAPFHDASG